MLVQERTKLAAELQQADAAAAEAKRQLAAAQAEDRTLREQLAHLRESLAADQDAAGRAARDRAASEQVFMPSSASWVGDCVDNLVKHANWVTHIL